MTNVLYLIRGVSGSGKSYLAERLTKANYSADDFFMDDGEYKFDKSLIQEAHDYCQDEVRYAMEEKCPTIAVHNTFTRRWEMKPYYDLAKEYDYNVIEIVVKSDCFENVHGVPEETIAKQRARFEM